VIPGFQLSQDELLGWIVFLDPTLYVVVGHFFNLFLREVAEGMTQAKCWLDCGVNNDSSPSSFFKGEGGSCPEDVELSAMQWRSASRSRFAQSGMFGLSGAARCIFALEM
jgi:hypothetical protein